MNARVTSWAVALDAPGDVVVAVLRVADGEVLFQLGNFRGRLDRAIALLLKLFLQ